MRHTTAINVEEDIDGFNVETLDFEVKDLMAEEEVDDPADVDE
jgi:hypothetical protein